MLSLKSAAPAAQAPFERASVASPLNLDEVCRRMSLRLRWYGLTYLRLEQVEELDDGSLGAVVRDVRTRRRLVWTLDPHSGTLKAACTALEPQLVRMPQR